METQQTVSVLEKVRQKVDGQAYAVINIIGPGLRQTHDETAFRILGVFPEYMDGETGKKPSHYAEQFAKRSSQLDDRWDYYVVSMYEFLPIPKEVHDVGNVVYDEDQVNKLLQAHEENKTETADFNQRVESSLTTGTDSWGMAGL